ncbi:MAG: TetR/AcrR family transcriptional regulator [Verrucomicrobiota bacterium]
MDAGQTRERLLQAAEVLYAEQGFEATSMRDLTTAAGTNLAAVNYHFGSKRALLMELCRQRIVPINAERLERLEKARIRANGAPVPLTDIIEAFLRPVGKHAQQDGRPNIVFLRMVGRIMTESDDFLDEMVSTFFVNLAEAFITELARTLPDLSHKELGWRFHFCISTMLGSLTQHHRLDRNGYGALDHDDIDGMIDRLRDFIVGGIQAPVTTEKALT